VQFTKVRNVSCCPSFLIATSGPWVVVLGAVIADMVVVQRLTDSVWVVSDSALHESRISNVARMFHSLRMGFERLHLYYRGLKPTGDLSPSTRFFPSITAYHDGSEIIPFEYLGYLENDSSCTAIRARTCTRPTRDIVVKFTERYSVSAHEVLTEAGLATKLLYSGPPGRDITQTQPSYQPLIMVVMDYVDGRTLVAAKNTMKTETEDKVRKDVRQAIELLHDRGLVFGDLRPPNVLIDGDNEVKLIDFDWAGEQGQVRFPSLISSSVRWPDGVKAMDIIEYAHDYDMLSRLLQK
jgi:serine/threonine protein kinase